MGDNNLLDVLAAAYSAAMSDPSVRTMHDAARRIIADLAAAGFSITRESRPEKEENANAEG